MWDLQLKAETLGITVLLCFLFSTQGWMKEGIAPRPELAVSSQEERSTWHLDRLALLAENTIAMHLWMHFGFGEVPLCL